MTTIVDQDAQRNMQALLKNQQTTIDGLQQHLKTTIQQAATGKDVSGMLQTASASLADIGQQGAKVLGHITPILSGTEQPPTPVATIADGAAAKPPAPAPQVPAPVVKPAVT